MALPPAPHPTALLPQPTNPPTKFKSNGLEPFLHIVGCLYGLQLFFGSSLLHAQFGAPSACSESSILLGVSPPSYLSWMLAHCIESCVWHPTGAPSGCLHQFGLLPQEWGAPSNLGRLHSCLVWPQAGVALYKLPASHAHHSTFFKRTRICTALN